MFEIEETLKQLHVDKFDTERKIDDFTRHGRSPDDADYFDMIGLLESWLKIKNQIIVLTEVLESIKSNSTQK